MIASYINGDYKTVLLKDGTKIRATDVERPVAEYPENIDIKLTNFCDIGCPFCHENSHMSGETTDLDKIKGLFWQLKLRTYTEVALGGGALSSIPWLNDLFVELWCRGIIVNITINQLELTNSKHPDFLSDLKEWMKRGVVKGVGISFSNKSEILEELNREFPGRIVIHTIAGITTPEQYEYLIEKRFKILVLGYKNLRRGESFAKEHSLLIQRNFKWLDENIIEISKSARSISFDCLATEQLNMRDKISEKDWNRFYMGDDGTITMYIDMVKNEYAKSSTSLKRYPIQENDTIDSIFKVIREE